MLRFQQEGVGTGRRVTVLLLTLFIGDDQCTSLPMAVLIRSWLQYSGILDKAQNQAIKTWHEWFKKSKHKNSTHFHGISGQRIKIIVLIADHLGMWKLYMITNLQWIYSISLTFWKETIDSTNHKVPHFYF